MGDSLMESRGQKRPELGDELPADKRSCTSQEFIPNSSTLTPDVLVTSTISVNEAQEANMETSSPSASGQSEGDEEERDSPYNSDNSDNSDNSNDMNDGNHRYASLREHQRNLSSRDSAKFGGLLSSLSNEAESSIQLAALTELCELLLFAVEESITTTLANQLAPLLVKLAKHENNPHIMLLAIRALTYLCEVSPRSSNFLVSHDAVPALCQRLIIIEYLDVAEQCLQALEKISRHQPLPCLQSGAIMAVLGYIDFFSTNVQRTALQAVVNICKKLPSECPSSVMEAVPKLCNLLQYEDQQLVELAVTSVIKIVDRVKGSPEMLFELYNNGLIGQVTHLLKLNGRITLSQPTYTGLVGLIANIASVSTDAVRTLFELNIGNILKDALSNSDLSHGVLSRDVDKNCNQVHEILKLLHEILPKTARDDDIPLSSKEKLLMDQSDSLQKFGLEIFPPLMQMVNSGTNMNICYGCLSIISRLAYFSKSEPLSEMMKEINFASFLAGVFSLNDQHVLSLALHIAEIVLEKLSNVFMQAFIKEGVLFAIDALLMPPSSSLLRSPMLDYVQSNKKSGKGVTKCLCDEYNPSHPVSTSKSKVCMLEKESVHNIAERIKSKYFSLELFSSHGTVSDLLQDLRYASAAITDLLSICTIGEENADIEEKLSNILQKVLPQLTGNEPISTFELIESGIIKALLSYLSNGLYLKRNCISDVGFKQHYVVEKRFEAFLRITLNLPGSMSKESPMSLFVRKLQSALLTVENFPTVVRGMIRQRGGSYATVPSGQHTAYPCFRVRFVKGTEELSLIDYVKGVVTVDPFCKVYKIERHLISKVCSKKVVSEGDPQGSFDSKNASTEKPGKSLELERSKILYNPSPIIQGSFEDEFHSSEADTNLKAFGSTSLSGDEENPKDDPSKLVLYLDGQPLEYSSTLYQEILQRQMKSQTDLQNFAELWSFTYKITYKSVEATESSIEKEHKLYDNSALDQFSPQQSMPIIFDIYVKRLGSSVDPASPVSDVLYLLKSMEMMNRFSNHLLCCERLNAFGKGKMDDLDNLKVIVPTMSQFEFVSNRLTEKFEQQICDSSTINIGAMPLWCNHLISGCPFLFSFEARCKYFQLAAFGRPQTLPSISHSDPNMPRERRSTASTVPRKKFLACRDQILESATQMMELYAHKNVVIEVEYIDEVGTGLGPTLEFYALVSREFQKAGLGMWRGDFPSPTNSYCHQSSSSGLFPRPWSPKSSNINGIEFDDVIKRFALLGQIVGKALRDGRILDIPFSKAFYKLVLGKELSICDIQTFEPELGKTLLEFEALSNRKRFLEIESRDDVAPVICLGFWDSNIEDLSLNFTLPGYPDYTLASGMDGDLMVTSNNLAEYVSMVLDATLKSGISRQVEAFKSGLNQVISVEHLYLFTEEELERLLCGEPGSWVSNDLFDHIKFDHGYTASSTPIINLLEVISEFDYVQRRSFLQFVTGAPRLPPGGLASLNPKMTIVCKHSSNIVDTDLPSVMTCANYLKLPPYSSKETMKDKLLYAITEGQGSFHLS